MKEREARRILQNLGLGPPQPSEGAVVKPPSSKAKAAKKNNKQTKK